MSPYAEVVIDHWEFPLTCCYDVFVFRVLSGQYILGVYRYVKEWRKNPQWSLSCFLALVLPLSDLQGEISGFAETDALKSQLKTGNMEMSTILIALEDGGATDDSLEKETGYKHGRQDFDNSTEGQGQNVRDSSLSSQRNQETQTEPFIILSHRYENTRENCGEMIINLCKLAPSLTPSRSFHVIWRQ